ncbi:MAG: hypothetical protein FWG40_01360 [Peptococcaceae bacterium]|nr:hypothetical protein [Peptococcaceae bacterium]
MATRRKNLFIVFGVLALFLLSAIVYAAIAGLLVFNGMALLNPGLRVDFVDESLEGGPLTVDMEVVEAIEVTDSGQTLKFTVYLSAPGQSRDVFFKVKNVGALSAELDTIIPGYPGELPAGVLVDWPEDIDGLILEPGETSDEYTITVSWDDDYDFAELEDDLGPLGDEDFYEVSFSATLNYVQHIEP